MRELLNLFEKLNDCIELQEKVITEESDVTYYELRKLVTMLYKTTKKAESKTVLGDILKSLTVMELQKKPVPTIQKLKSKSPKVFE